MSPVPLVKARKSVRNRHHQSAISVRRPKWSVTIRRRLSVLPLVLLLSVIRVHAATYHVSPQGTNTPPYASYATAANQVRDAAELAAGDGDTVLVHAGSYGFSDTTSILAGVALIGVGSDSVTFIWDGPAGTPATMVFLRGGNEVCGLEFSNPLGDFKSPDVGAIWALSAQPISLHDCRIDHCYLYFDGSGNVDIHRSEFHRAQTWAIRVGNDTCRIRQCNFLGSGTGVRATSGGYIEIERNSFREDSANKQTQMVAATISNCDSVVFRNNLVFNANWVLDWSSSSGIVENNSIAGVRYESSLLVYLDPLQHMAVRNNVFIDAQIPLFFTCHNCSPPPSFTVQYNCYWPPVSTFWHTIQGSSNIVVNDSNNLNAFPMFADDTLYQLQALSPLIDSGDPAVFDVDRTRSDIGWTGGAGGWTYEYENLPPLSPDSVFITGTDNLVQIAWTPRPEADVVGYRLYHGVTPNFWEPGLQPFAHAVAPDTSVILSLDTEYNNHYFVMTAIDASGNESPPSQELEYILSIPPLPPHITGPQQSTLDEGQHLILHFTAIDPNGDAVYFAASNLPRNASICDNGDGNATLTFDPSYQQAGEYNMGVIASDGLLADTLQIQILVVETGNHQPHLARVEDQVVGEGSLLAVPLSATDVDGDSLVLLPIKLPARAELLDYGDGSGLVTFSPRFGDGGEYTVMLLVTDGSLSDTITFRLAVVVLGDSLPLCPEIIRVYPNPSNSSIAIEISMPLSVDTGSSHVLLLLYNALGQFVATVFDGQVPPGKTLLSWSMRRANGGSLASGLYVLKLSAASGFVHGSKLIVVLR